MATLNLSYTALHIDIVTMCVYMLTYMEYFVRCGYVLVHNNVGNFTYVSPLFSIIAIQMKPKIIFVLYNTQKIPLKSCIFFQDLLTEP
jgi:hypothetical protein